MQILSTIGYLLLFILFLSILVIVHELGHFSMAKAFKVYCLEFSCGFGPKLISKKKKGGETAFSIRAIPFGGYVSMYGEGMELPEGITVDPSRSLNGIKKWKRAIILVAGVVMNAILALTLFFVSEVAFVQKQVYINEFSVSESSIASEVGIETGDRLAFFDDYDESIKSYFSKDEQDVLYVVDDEAIVTNVDDSTSKAICVLYLEALSDYNHLSLNNYFYFFEMNENVPNWEKQIVTYSEIKSFTINLHVYNLNDENKPEWKEIDPLVINVALQDAIYSLEDVGLSFSIHEYWNNFGQAVGNTFKDFGNSSTAIIRAFGSLFTSSEARESMGGIIAIGFETTNVLKTFGFGKFLYIWGLISVNLAIVNLFPFPGLDGWQLLVLIVEATAHKEIPNKVKNIISIVGIGLLFILMGILVFKDIFTFII